MKRLYAILLIRIFVILNICLLPVTSVRAEWQDVSNQIQLNSFRPLYNLRERLSYFQASLVNGSNEYPAPIRLVITSINNPAVTVHNADGFTDEGYPYFEYSNYLGDGILQAGEESQQRTIELYNPNRQRYSFSSRIETDVAVNTPPVANAGLDRTVFVGDSVQLDGSASSDLDGDQLNYQWAFSGLPSGSQAALIGADTFNPSLTIDLPGRYEIQLTVNDGTEDSSPDTVVITTQNSKPVADAGSDQSGFVGDNIQLDGINSFDADSDPLSYHWSLPVVPNGSQAILNNPNLIDPVFTLDLPGSYQAELKVHDGSEFSTPDRVIISTLNSRPVADSGPDQTAFVGDTVVLDGSASSDADYDVLSFEWSLISKPDNSTAQIAEPSQEQTSFVPDLEGLYIAQLVVRDASLASNPDTSKVTVQVLVQNHAPVITSSPVTTASVNQAYQYDVNATDIDGDVVTYSLSTAPDGMGIEPNTGVIDWIPGINQTGSNSVTVKVEDDQGLFAEQIFSIDVNVIVPDLIGLDRTSAENTINQSGFKVGALDFQHDSAVEGIVITQIPGKGTQGALGDAVSMTISLGPDVGLPPNPVVIAPKLDQTVVTSTYASTEFLYTGQNPIQTGVSLGTINPKRAAVIRGRLLDKGNNPLPGVTIAVKDHPELGQTLSRIDGRYDLVVNGGGMLTLNYQKADYLPSQRQVNTPWQDFAFAEDVVMIQQDAKLNSLDLTDASEAFHVAQGSVITDDDGTRQATLFIPHGTQAQVYNSDGSTTPVTMLNLRLTEYTVGENGPESMPGPLPSSSAYTYAFEMKAEEANTKISGKDVLFDRPVTYYITNFLNFPVGMAVPVGYYDRDKSTWIPSENGRIIKIITIANGIAQIDSDGDDLADDVTTLATLGVTEEEKAQLATLYSEGQTLWRVQVTHLSTWDCNWPYKMPDDAVQPKNSAPNKKEKAGDPCEKLGSIIECENQTLRESLPITGTAMTLNYASDRVPGRKAENSIEIPLSGEQLPATLKRIDLIVDVAGRRFEQSFPPQPNQVHTFNWDGTDSFGRSVYGAQPTSIRIGYVYDPVYATPAEMNTAFAQFSGVPLEGSRARNEVRIFQDQTFFLGTSDFSAKDVGGWSLSPHHSYDPINRILYFGDGTRLSNTDSLAAGGVLTNFAGNGLCSDNGDGGLATDASMGGSIWGLATAPDGSVYIMDINHFRIRKVTPDGVISAYAGTGQYGFSGDGGPALQARFGLIGPNSGAVGPDGSLFVIDYGNNRVRKIDPNGIITTVAGNGVAGFSGDGGPAVMASLRLAANGGGVAVAADGSLYISDYNNQRIRKVTPDGIINTVAGTGISGFSGDGGLATEARLNYPNSVTVGQDGSFYIADNQRVRKVSIDGIISTIAGDGSVNNTGVDGVNALQTRVAPGDVAVSSDGVLFILEPTYGRIRKVSQDGVISTVAGGGTTTTVSIGSPATGIYLSNAYSFAIDNELNIYTSRSCGVTKISNSFTGFNGGEIALPSQDGTILYRFDATGRHLATLNAITGATLLSFEYDTNGNLSSVTNADNLITKIERDSLGLPIAIVGLYGQRSELIVDDKGYLTSITNPANESYQMNYTEDGLLSAFKDPRNNVSTFTYDLLGRLLTDVNAVGGSWSLARTGQTDGYTVSITSELNRTSSHTVRNLATGDRERSHVQPDNTSSTSLEKTNGSITITSTDGALTNLFEGPDPRFGMLAPINQSYSMATGGKTLTATTTRETILATPNDPLSLSSLTETYTLNGRASTLVYDQSSKTFTSTSAANRQSTRVIDNLGRTLQTEVSGILPVTKSYDLQGRLENVTQGSGADQRQISYSYNTQGYLANVIDPLSRTTSYNYDAVGRIVSQTLPDTRQIGFEYDPKGNITALTPSGRPAHEFKYNALGQVIEYLPPVVNGSDTTSTRYRYDLDKSLSQVIRPDGLTLDFDYDPAGRLSKLSTPTGDTVFGYDSDTGKLINITAPGDQSLSFTYSGSLLTQTAWDGTIVGNVGFAYDNDFRVASISVNNANPITYQYDADSLLIRVGDLTLTRNSQIGLLKGTALGNVTDSYNYNNYGELSSYVARYSGSDLLKTDFARDKLGRVTQKIETIGGVTHTYDYTYDLAGRLSEVRRDTILEESYDYDDNSNRTRLNGSEIAHYDAQDRLLDYNGTTYAYTAKGELQSKTAGATMTTYRYDVLGNLREATLPNGDHLEYVIDGQNRRIGKKRNGVLEQGFIYQSQLKPIVELDGSGSIVARFVYSTGVNVPDFIIKGGVTYRLIKDHLGSVRLVVAADTGAVAQSLNYDSWGNVMVDSNPGFQPFGFAGGIYDRDTGLVRFGARDYDGATGRWFTKDSLGFYGESYNFYTYANNDPVNYFDIDGLRPTIILFRECIFFYIWNDYLNSFNTAPETLDEANKRKAQEVLRKLSPGASFIGYEFVQKSQNVFHTQCDQKQNRKIIFDDGSEGVYDLWTGNLVTDSRNMGTKNLFNPRSEFLHPYTILHGIFDVIPYIACGNSIDDPSTFIERLKLSVGW